MKIGGENEILVKVYNIDSITDAKTRKLLYPPGWHRDINLHGIWGNVSIEIHPDVYIRNVSIFTFVKTKTISVSAEVTNISDTPSVAELSFSALAQSASEIQFKSNAENIPPGETRILRARAKWLSPKLWSPKDPFLYEFESILVSDGKEKDKKKAIFGFREFSIEKNEFALNGKKIHLFGTCFHIVDIFDHLDPASPERTFNLLKYANINVVRLMDQPWPRHWYETADRMGMLVIGDTAITPDGTQNISDPVYWENASEHIKSYVKNNVNHPSIIIWNLSSEIDSTLSKNKEVTRKELEAQMIKLKYETASIDPVRPAMNEGVMDFGNADIENIHYPREYVYDLNMGGSHYQYPNSAFWFRFDKKSGLRKNPAIPYYIGETLWEPSRTPDGDTVFVGDKAYINFLDFKQIAKAKALFIQLKAYRFTNIPGVSPWNIFEEKFWGNSWKDEHIPSKNPLVEACKKAFEPVAAFVKEYNSRFLSESLLKRNITVFNDSISDKYLTSKTSLIFNGTVQNKEVKSFSIKAGERYPINISFRLPKTANRKDFLINISISDNGKELFFDKIPYSLFPQIQENDLPLDNILIYDPSDSLSFLNLDKSQYLTTVSLKKIPNDSVIIVGENAFTSPLQDNAKISRAIADFIKNGGHALVLKQEQLPYEIFPIKNSNHSPTMVYIRAKGHPVFKGIREDDLSFWQGNNIVADDCYLKPDKGIVRTLADSGGKGGLIYSPLLECFSGKGSLILCQMNVISKYDVEPTAEILLKNMLDYLNSKNTDKTEPADIFLIEGEESFLKKLNTFSINPVDIRKKFLPSFTPGKNIFIAGPDKNSDFHFSKEIIERIKSGDILYIKGLTPNSLERFKSILPYRISLEKPFHSPPFIITENPLILGISNQEFYWTTGESRLAQHPLPLRKDIISYAVNMEGSDNQGIEKTIGFKDITYSKGFEIVNDKLVTTGNSDFNFDILSDNNSAAVISFEIESDNSENLEFIVSLKNSYFPKKKIISIKTIPSSRQKVIKILIPVTSGINTVSIETESQKKKPPSLLKISKITYSLLSEDNDVVPMIFPSALIKVKLGKGVIVIDQLNWDALPENSSEISKTKRFINTLFTNLIH